MTRWILLASLAWLPGKGQAVSREAWLQPSCPELILLKVSAQFPGALAALGGSKHQQDDVYLFMRFTELDLPASLGRQLKLEWNNFDLGVRLVIGSKFFVPRQSKLVPQPEDLELTTQELRHLGWLVDRLLKHRARGAWSRFLIAWYFDLMNNCHWNHRLAAKWLIDAKPALRSLEESVL